MHLEQWVILPDLHFPFHDPKFLRLAEKLIGEIKPRGIVQLGDALDWFQISSYDKDPSRLNTTTDDLLEYKAQLDIFEQLLPKGAVFHQLEGNHEDRLRRYIWARAPHIAKMIKSIPEMLGIPERNRRGKVKFHWHPLHHWKSCRIADTFLFHGFFYSKHVAAQLLDRYKHKVICGHTHRVQVVYDGALWAVTLGHGSNEDQTAHTPVPTTWQQAMGVLTVLNGRANIEIIPVYNGAATFRGKKL